MALVKLPLGLDVLWREDTVDQHGLMALVKLPLGLDVFSQSHLLGILSDLSQWSLYVNVTIYVIFLFILKLLYVSYICLPFTRCDILVHIPQLW